MPKTKKLTAKQQTVHKVMANTRDPSALPFNADGSRVAPARARAESIEWMDGSMQGPQPNHFTADCPDDLVRSETRERIPLIASDDPAVVLPVWGRVHTKTGPCAFVRVPLQLDSIG